MWLTPRAWRTQHDGMGCSDAREGKGRAGSGVESSREDTEGSLDIMNLSL